MSTSWWRASLRARPLARLLSGWSAPLIWTGAGLTASGCADVLSEVEPDRAQASLQTQQQDGWNVGDEGRPLAFPGAQPNDISGTLAWRERAVDLGASAFAGGAALVALLRPHPVSVARSAAQLRSARGHQPDLQPRDGSGLAPRRGAALALLRQRRLPERCRRRARRRGPRISGAGGGARALLRSGVRPRQLAAPGWRRPRAPDARRGALLPAIVRAGPVDPFADAPPPLFVLDRQRLAPYTDDAGLFDNRYFAGLPSREALQSAGIRQLLYVTPDEVSMDADDLNGDLVALDEGGIDVKMLALSDFSQTPLPGWPTAPVPGCPSTPLSFGHQPPYYFGGSPASQGCFPWWYGWRLPSPLANGGHSGPFIPPRLAPRCQFHPRPRAILPMATGVRGSGGWRQVSGGGFGRSGSLGRAHGGFGA